MVLVLHHGDDAECPTADRAPAQGFAQYESGGWIMRYIENPPYAADVALFDTPARSRLLDTPAPHCPVERQIAVQRLHDSQASGRVGNLFAAAEAWTRQSFYNAVHASVGPLHAAGFEVEFRAEPSQLNTDPGCMDQEALRGLRSAMTAGRPGRMMPAFS